MNNTNKVLISMNKLIQATRTYQIWLNYVLEMKMGIDTNKICLYIPTVNASVSPRIMKYACILSFSYWCKDLFKKNKLERGKLYLSIKNWNIPKYAL